MKSWEQMSEHEQLSAIHYDMYKDAHGIRPRWIEYDTLTVSELRQSIEQLESEISFQIAEEEKRQAVAIQEFEAVVQNAIEFGAGDRETALRWLIDDGEACGDREYFCFLNGLPYGYFKKEAA